jgi:hypothetical protein
MSIALWIIQIILGIKLLSVFYTHGINPSQASMQSAIKRMGKYTRSFHLVISASSLIGTMGLILPRAMGSNLWITPVTAMLVSILLLSSIIFHLKCREKSRILVSIILSAMAAFAAYGCWVILP